MWFPDNSATLFRFRIRHSVAFLLSALLLTVGARAQTPTPTPTPRPGIPGTERKILNPNRGVESDLSYMRVAMDGRYLLTGIPDGKINGQTQEPRAVLHRMGSGGEWELEHVFALPDGAPETLFAASCDICSDTVAITAFEVLPSGYYAGSVYVFVRDAEGDWVQQARLTPGDSATSTSFASDVAIHADTILVGCGRTATTGPAVAFVRDAGGVWSQQESLSAPADRGSGYGREVALWGDVAAISDHLHDIRSYTDAGRVFVYERDGGAWGEPTTLTRSTPGWAGYFGRAVAVENDILVIGADTPIADQGEAWVFQRTGPGSWSEVTRLQPGDCGPMSYFGCSADISSRTLLVGAYGQGPDYDDYQGAAYSFTETSPGTWQLQHTFVPSARRDNQRYGRYVAIGDGLVAAGGRYHVPDDWATPIPGTFRYEAGSWTRIADGVVLPSPASNYFGAAVAISSASLLVGASGGNAAVHAYDCDADNLEASRQSIASPDGLYYFGQYLSMDADWAWASAVEQSLYGSGSKICGEALKRDAAGNWSLAQEVEATDLETGQHVRERASIWGQRAAVGMNMSSYYPGDGTGTVHMFQRDSSGQWVKEQVIFPEDSDEMDYFGWAVALWEDTLAVGAITGTNQQYSTTSGTVFVYRRNASNEWNCEAVLSPTTATSAFACYGYRLALREDTLVVSSNYEDPLDVFVRQPSGQWLRQASLLPSDLPPCDDYLPELALGDNLLLAGYVYGGDPDLYSGVAYLFARNLAGEWSELESLLPASPASGQGYGCSVALSATQAAVGAKGDDEVASNAGAVFLYDLPTPTPAPPATPTPTATPIPGMRPKIVSQPQNVCGEMGGQARFHVAASGETPLNFTWLRNLRPVEVDPDHTVQHGTTSSTLVIGNLQRDDIGLYRCSVSNANGGVVSNPALLWMYGPLGIVSHPTTQTVCMGGRAEFRVYITGTPPFIYRWMRNGVPVGSRTITGVDTDTLVIDPTTFADVGVYACEITGGDPQSTTQTEAVELRFLPTGIESWWSMMR